MSLATTVKAHPQKRFFVSMLTRDIDLKDAVLDLIDNCLDGVLRQVKDKPDKEYPYEDYWVRIAMSPEGFEIKDNCGGIPVDIAIESAFMLGRPDDLQDSDIETIGMYGIGMKRAIFKMGRKCEVFSHPLSGEYKKTYAVKISPEWMENDAWDIPIEYEQDPLDENGTLIKVSNLYDPISTQFDQGRSEFINELVKDISSHYARIIGKGFKVFVNDNEGVQYKKAHSLSWPR